MATGKSGFLVGVTGFEPATSSSRTTRATKLRYTPTAGREGWALSGGEQGEIYLPPDSCQRE